MKNIYVVILLLLFPFSALIADENELNISGMVYENPEINPVPGHMVSIEIPPNNVWDGYSNEVFTNEGGFYADEIILPENVTQGEVFLSTTDCNGFLITELFYFSPEMMTIEHDFVLCDEPFPDCVAGFFWEPLEGNGIQFINTSLPENITCTWNFGDGETSGEYSPQHNYAEAGIYNVCLSIYNEELNCEDEFCMEVIVGNGGGCEAFFDWGPAPDNPVVIAFLNMSTGGEGLEYLWEFGDGETSDEMNPEHDYAEPGVYLVCLEISGEGCEDDYCTEVFVDEWPGECMAEFEFEIYEDNSVQFFNFSFPPESNYLWDFGDGTTSEEFEPMHIYEEPAGEYDVCLTIWSEQMNCEDVICKEVSFEGGGGECEAYYTWWPSDEPLTIQFMDYSWIENGQFQWEFGDGNIGEGPDPVHTYEEPGVYEVCLVGFNNECEDIYCEEVVVEGNGGGGNCQADFEWEQLEGLQIQFFNISQPQEAAFFWEFGDGNGYYEHSPLHLYDEPGVYEVCLNIYTADGCEDMFCLEVVVEGQGGGGLSASFEMEVDPENPLMVHFFDTSEGNPAAWLWEFGDGITSEEKNPVHSYQEGGVYDICLTIFDNIHDPDTYCTTIEISETYFSAISENQNIVNSVYPNPARSEIFVDLNNKKAQAVELIIFNALMQEVKSLDSESVNAGDHTFSLQVSDLNNGIYILGIKTGTDYFTKKIIISK